MNSWFGVDKSEREKPQEVPDLARRFTLCKFYLQEPCQIVRVNIREKHSHGYSRGREK